MSDKKLREELGESVMQNTSFPARVAVASYGPSLGSWILKFSFREENFDGEVFSPFNRRCDERRVVRASMLCCAEDDPTDDVFNFVDGLNPTNMTDSDTLTVVGEPDELTFSYKRINMDVLELHVVSSGSFRNAVNQTFIVSNRELYEALHRACARFDREAFNRV